MQVDVDEIFKKFYIKIVNNISFKEKNFEYLDKLPNEIYDNDNYVYIIDVPRDDNCVFWSATQAFEKRIIDKKSDYQKMLDLRKK